MQPFQHYLFSAIDNENRKNEEARILPSSSPFYTTPAAIALFDVPKVENKVKGSGKRKLPIEDSPEMIDHRNNLLALWIGSSNLPTSMVDDPNFLNFLRSWNPDVNNPNIDFFYECYIKFQATLPGRKKVGQTINTLSDKSCEFLKENLSQGRRVIICVI